MAQQPWAYPPMWAILPVGFLPPASKQGCAASPLNPVVSLHPSGTGGKRNWQVKWLPLFNPSWVIPPFSWPQLVMARRKGEPNLLVQFGAFWFDSGATLSPEPNWTGFFGGCAHLPFFVWTWENICNHRNGFVCRGRKHNFLNTDLYEREVFGIMKVRAECTNGYIFYSFENTDGLRSHLLLEEMHLYASQY